MAAIDRIGNEAARLGECLSLDFLRYNSVVMKNFDVMSTKDAPGVIAALRAQFPAARRVIDVGAGSCAYAAEAMRQGISVTAIERSRHGRRRGRRHGVSALPFDLQADPPTQAAGPFDLAYCFEVAEHMPASLGDRLVSLLCTLAPIVVFTAASPGQGGTGHINEQPAEYWVSRFAALHYEPEEFRVATEGLNLHWAKTNKLAFRAASAAPPSGKL